MNGPLVAGFTVYSDFFGYRGGVYHWDHVSQAVGGPAIAMVGYDSNEQYWIVKNSWGSYWGENGYFRIGFGEAGINNYVASMRAAVNGLHLLFPRRLRSLEAPTHFCMGASCGSPEAPSHPSRRRCQRTEYASTAQSSSSAFPAGNPQDEPSLIYPSRSKVYARAVWS